MSWAAHDAADEAILRRLPKGPGRRNNDYDEFAGGSAGALRFSADFLAFASQPSSGSKAGKAKKQRQQQEREWGQDMTQVFRCRACAVDSSGAVSLAQHWCDSMLALCCVLRCCSLTHPHTQPGQEPYQPRWQTRLCRPAAE